jgi:hypothetical protein
MKTKTANKAPLVHDAGLAAIDTLIGAIKTGAKAYAVCAATLDGIVANWARYDGRKAKTPTSLKAHCAELEITVAQGKQVKAWMAYMTAEFQTMYKEQAKADKDAGFRDSTPTDAEIGKATGAFVQSVKRHSPSYFQTDKQAGKGVGKAKASNGKKASKAKAKPEAEKSDVELAGQSPKALRTALARFMPAIDALMNARGIKGLSVDTLDKAKLLLEQACELISKAA